MSTVGEASEEVRGPVLAPDAPAELGGVVVDRPTGDASGELEHGAEPLADALGGLAPEGLGGPHAGAREGDGGAPAPANHAANPETRLPEVHLGLAGQPAELQVPLHVPGVPLLRHLLAPAPRVALRGGVGTAVALLVAQADEDSGGRVPLLPPVVAVV